MNSVDFSLIETLALFPSFQETDHLGVFLLWEALIVNIARKILFFFSRNQCVCVATKWDKGIFCVGISI